jgi:hypothetical protein
MTSTRFSVCRFHLLMRLIFHPLDCAEELHDDHASSAH